MAYNYIYGSAQDDVIHGTESYYDVIYGYEGNDVIYGHGLSDQLYGGVGNDTIYGQAGSDMLYGNSGTDTLDGGTGLDAFVFNSALGPNNVDTIRNYVVADDLIRLENSIFTALTVTGTLSSDAFCVGTEAQDPSDRIIYDSATGDLWYDADGTGEIAAVKFATLVGVTGTVTNADFMVD